ncbi:hypothetical protein ACFLXW_00430 [Candidatus Dependentiae bacterium]
MQLRKFFSPLFVTVLVLCNASCFAMKNEDGDLEKGRYQSSNMCSVSSSSKKRLALITALLVAGVAGSAGGYYASGSHNVSPDAVSGTVPPAVQPPSKPVRVRRLIFGAGGGPNKKGFSFRGEFRARAIAEINDYENNTLYALENPQSWNGECPDLSVAGYDFTQILNHFGLNENSYCKVVPAINGSFNMGTFQASNTKFRMAWGANTGPNGECRVECIDSIQYGDGWPIAVCRSSELVQTFYKKYDDKPSVQPELFKNLTCTFTEKTVAQKTMNKLVKARTNATRPTRERRQKQAKHRGNKR